jgi:hypothetical protein
VVEDRLVLPGTNATTELRVALVGPGLVAGPVLPRDVDDGVAADLLGDERQDGLLVLDVPGHDEMTNEEPAGGESVRVDREVADRVVRVSAEVQERADGEGGEQRSRTGHVCDVVAHAGGEYHLSEPRVEKRDDDQSDPEPGGSEQPSRPNRSLAGGRSTGRAVACVGRVSQRARFRP